MSTFLTTTFCGLVAASTFSNINAQSDDWVETRIIPDTPLKGMMGWSVSISGDLGVIGNWNADDGEISYSYIVNRDEITNEWSILRNIMGSGTVNTDQFGNSVDIDQNQNIIVVGAPLEKIFVKGGQVGAVYIFTLNQSTGSWDRTRVFGSTSQIIDQCGTSVAISGNTLIFGCPGEAINDAKVFIFEYDDVNGWVETAIFTGEFGFGTYVSIYNDYAFVGGNIYKRAITSSGSSWSQVTISNVPNESLINAAVSICNDYAMISVKLADTNNVFNSGKVYLLKNVVGSNGNEWTYLPNVLTKTVLSEMDQFGFDIDLNCDVNNYYAGIVASGDDLEATNAGAVYIFKPSSDNEDIWEQTDVLTLSDAEVDDELTSVSVDGDCIITSGAFRHISDGSDGAVSIFCRPQSTSDSCMNAELSLSSVLTRKFYEYYLELESSDIYNHMLTTVENPSINVNYKLTQEQFEGYLWYQQTNGVTVPLYRQYSRVDKNHYYTISNQLWGDNSLEYFVAGIAGYVMTESCPGLNKPVYTYWSSTKRDHQYNTNYDTLGEGNGDYVLVSDDEGNPVVFYVAIA